MYICTNRSIWQKQKVLKPVFGHNHLSVDTLGIIFMRKNKFMKSFFFKAGQNILSAVGQMSDTFQPRFTYRHACLINTIENINVFRV